MSERAWAFSLPAHRNHRARAIINAPLSSHDGNGSIRRYDRRARDDDGGGKRWFVACGSDPPGGEEIFVLDGAVEDEEGRYATGSWLRNPPGSQHAPFSLEGCLLYVKIGHLPTVTSV